MKIKIELTYYQALWLKDNTNPGDHLFSPEFETISGINKAVEYALDNPDISHIEEMEAVVAETARQVKAIAENLQAEGKTPEEAFRQALRLRPMLNNNPINR